MLLDSLEKSKINIKDLVIEEPQAWDEVTLPLYEEIVRGTLLPEFLNRLDARFVYRPLPLSVIEGLVEREIADISL